MSSRERGERARLTRGVAAVLTASLAASSVACSGATIYQPRLLARGELALQYADGFELYAGGKLVTRGHSYRGLDRFVGCVPEAKHHAEEAQSEGSSATAFSVLGGVLAGVGLASLGGLYFYERDDAMMWGILGAGLGVEALAVTFAAVSRGAKRRAHGNAIDAMNYYNDRVGSLGATCDDLTYPAPESEAPPAIPERVAPTPSRPSRPSSPSSPSSTSEGEPGEEIKEM
jgi:hypothetical protein